MHVVNVGDLSRTETMAAIRATQHCSIADADSRPFCRCLSLLTDVEIFDLLGGRLSYISKVLKSKGDLVEAARQIVEQEKNWLLARRTMIGELQ
jgi:hypothetical protein